MMRENPNLDFSALSERISAQTDAYVEFASAMVKVIESLASVRDKVDGLEQTMGKQYEALSQKVQDVIKAMGDASHLTSQSLGNLNREHIDLRNSLDSLTKTIESLAHNSEKSSESLNDIVGDLIAQFKDTVETIIGNQDKNHNAIEAIKAENRRFSTTALTKLEQIAEEAAKNKHRGTKLRTVAWAMGIIIGAFYLLQAMNIIQISWFN